jgi:5-methyltetrahydrofolate--homocysteine methyltransferase
MEALTDPDKRASFVERKQREATLLLEKEAHRSQDGEGSDPNAPIIRSNVAQDVPVPAPPFWGYKVLEQRHIPLDEVFDRIDLTTLFRLSWGAHKLHGEEYDRAVAEELMPRFARMRNEMRGRQLLTPKVIYGYFPCQSSGNDLIVYDAVSIGDERGEDGRVVIPDAKSLTPKIRFTFPRQPDREHLCLADYFRSVESGEVDVVPLQVVTMGNRASEAFEQMQKAGDYSEGYFLYGLSVSSAEGLAEWTHDLVLNELGLPKGQGRRYSWGYPACPDPAEQVKLLEVLPAERIGVELTDGYVLVPEQSTAAIVVPHPQGKYYTTRPMNRGIGRTEAEEEAEGRGYVEPGVSAAVASR